MARRLRVFGRTRGGGRRQHERSPVVVTCKLSTFEQRQPGILLNISLGGAEVQVETPPDPGTEFFLTLPTGDFFGKVVWRTSSVCGLAFEPQLHPFDLQQLRFQV